MLAAVAALPPDTQSKILDRFSEVDFSEIRNKSAFMKGIVKRYAKKSEKQRPAPKAPAGPLDGSMCTGMASAPGSHSVHLPLLRTSGAASSKVIWVCLGPAVPHRLPLPPWGIGHNWQSASHSAPQHSGGKWVSKLANPVTVVRHQSTRSSHAKPWAPCGIVLSVGF